MKEIPDEFFDSIRDKYFRYEDYYTTLRISRKNVNDEIVEEAYLYQTKQLERLFRGIDSPNAIKLKKEILIILNDAYTALKTEHSRNNYDELIEKNRGEEK